MGVKTEYFGVLQDGNKVKKYILSNGSISVEVIEYGGIITSLRIPDRSGRSIDIVLGHNTLEEYLSNIWYFGAIVGRVAGRIRDGRFELNGKIYELEKNENNATHLHGGVRNFSKVIWDVKEFIREGSCGVRLHYFSRDGEEGYPGNLGVVVEYELRDNNQFGVTYMAETDAPTPVNLTNHSYFNLNGESSGRPVLNHRLQMCADNYISFDEASLPVGIEKVAGTLMNFKEGMLIGKNITDEFTGYDNIWLLNKIDEDKPSMTVVNPDNGIKMEVFTDQPCVVFFTGNGMDGTMKGKQNTPYNKHAGLCLETQGVSDAVNCSKFPSIIASPKKPYMQRTIWRFSLDPKA